MRLPVKSPCTGWLDESPWAGPNLELRSNSGLVTRTPPRRLGITHDGEEEEETLCSAGFTILEHTESEEGTGLKIAHSVGENRWGYALEEVERRTKEVGAAAGVHANSTFDEMRAREIKVGQARSTSYAGRTIWAALAEANGRTDAFATHFSTFPGIGVSEQGERAHSCISSTLFREVSPSLRPSRPP